MFPFNINRRRGNIIYYRCRFQPNLKCPATCKVQLSEEELEVKVNFFGEHNHEVQTKLNTSKKTKKKIEEMLVENSDQKPSIISQKIISKLSYEELMDNRNIPSRRQITYIKSKFIGASFPTQDHVWNSLLTHGDFEGATRFIRVFSLLPLLIVCSTEEGIKRLNGYDGILFVDSTHSTCSPTMNLFCLMSIYKGNR